MDSSLGAKFERLDCEAFARYPARIEWPNVRPEDQERFKSVRKRLEELAQQLAAKNAGSVRMRPLVSLVNPNAKSPQDIWCCVFPEVAENKSYALQVALIIGAAGAELCFCVGAGESQHKDRE